jgi:hypothetical protein
MTNFVINKKTIFLCFFFCLNVFGMITQAKGQSNNVPPWIDDVPPENELWGLGTAKLVNSRNSMDLAELRARCTVALDIYCPVFYSVDDDESNDLLFFFMMYASVDISFEIINDTKVLRAWESPDGTSWCLVAMDKADAKKYTSICENIYQRYYDQIFEE